MIASKLCSFHEQGYALALTNTFLENRLLLFYRLGKLLSSAKPFFFLSYLLLISFYNFNMSTNYLN